jgi:hypothetical protein
LSQIYLLGALEWKVKDFFKKTNKPAWVWWLTLVFLATWEAEIRWMVVQSHPRQN